MPMSEFAGDAISNAAAVAENFSFEIMSWSNPVSNRSKLGDAFKFSAGDC